MHKAIGRTGTDRVTGFTGTVTGHSEYLSGCSQLLVVAKSKDNDEPKAQWFDEQRVKISGDALTLENSATPGPDRPAPIR